MVTVAKSFCRPRARAACLAAGSALACVLAAPHASAQYSRTQEFQTGFSLLRFEPAKAGDRFFGVPDGFVPGNTTRFVTPEGVSSRFRALVLGDFVTSPILSRTNNLNGQTVDVISSQVLTHVELGYFPIDSLFFNAGLPVVWSQSGDSGTTPSGLAIGDARVGARYGLLGAENAGFSLAPSFDVWLPTGSQDKLTGDGKLRAEPAVTAGGRAGMFIWSAKVGYQFRRHIDIGSVEIGNSLTFGGAAGLLFLHDALQVGPELYGAALTSPSQDSMFAGRNTVLEAILGAKVHLGDWVLGAGAGPGLASAPGTAPRVLLSVAFAPQAPYAPPAESITPKSDTDPSADRDNDGVIDSEDACPDQRGLVREDPAKNGCPDAPKPPPPPEPEATGPSDRDHDAIPDDQDACPDEVGARSTDSSKNGCPVAALAEPPPDDTDGDGIPDSEDACKRVKGVASETPKWNGCPPPTDTDGDGIVDPEDACPKKAGEHSTDPKLNGCPPPPPPPPPKDSDKDGIPDTDDACRWKKGVASDDPKLNGCPPPPPPPTPKPAPEPKAPKAPPPPKPAPAPVTTKTLAAPVAKAAPKPGAPAELSFAGFRSFDDGTSLVFVELSASVTVNVKKQKNVVTYTLENTRVPNRNNRNPLLAAEFPSIVSRARLVPRKKAVELEIVLKADVEPQEQLVQRDGESVLEIRLPKLPPAPPPAAAGAKGAKTP